MNYFPNSAQWLWENFDNVLIDEVIRQHEDAHKEHTEKDNSKKKMASMRRRNHGQDLSNLTPNQLEKLEDAFNNYTPPEPEPGDVDMNDPKVKAQIEMVKHRMRSQGRIM